MKLKIMGHVNKRSLCENCNPMNVFLHTFGSIDSYRLHEIWNVPLNISTFTKEIFRIRTLFLCCLSFRLRA